MAASFLPFSEYWSQFVRAHRSPRKRRLQVVATSAGLGCAALGLLTRRTSLLLAAPVVGVVSPWLVGRVLEGPEELPTAPLYRVLACLKLWELTVTSGLEEELARLAREEAERDEAAEPVEEASHPATNMVTDHTLH